MIVDRHELQAVLSGKLDEVVIKHKPPSIGAEVALQSGVGKRARGRARIEDHWPITSGEHEGCHAVRLAIVTEEKPVRFLSSSGYTTDPDLAVRDEEGSPEWAPPAGWSDPDRELREVEQLDREHEQIARRVDRAASEVELGELLAMAREFGVDIRSDLRVINKRINAIKNKVQAGRQAA